MRPLTLPALLALPLAAACCLSTGCARVNRSAAPRGPQPRVQVYRVSDAAQAAVADAQANRATISGARNEWLSFAVQVTDLAPGAWHSLRLRPLRRQSSDASDALAAEVEAYQIVSMPVDVNRAGYVRHTGATTAVTDLPRALLPLPMSRGAIDLRDLRSPPRKANTGGNAKAPTSPPADAPPRIWIDVRIPPNAAPGEYAASLDLM